MAAAESSKNLQITKPSTHTEALPLKQTKSLANSSLNALRCTNNFEDTMFEIEALLNEHTRALESHKDTEIDVSEHTNVSDIKLVKDSDPDATEYSSSFGGTVSGAENSGHSEAEVESIFCGDDYGATPLHSSKEMFHMRKKKLTTHWRNFIRPLTWRCKWMELRIKAIESQKMKYDAKLATCDRRKQSDARQCVLEDGCSKSLPFSYQHDRKKVMKRRKRKRVEEVTDITSYMLNHNLFPYAEYKRSDQKGTCIADQFGNSVSTEEEAINCENAGLSDDQSIFEYSNGDNSLEMILSSIEAVHSRVRKLMGKLEMAISKNAGVPLPENLAVHLPCNPQTSPALSPAFSSGNGDTTSVGPISTQLMSDCDIGDPLMGESVVSSPGKVFHVPDIFESTAGLSSATVVTLHQPQIGDSCEAMSSVLIHDEGDEEMNCVRGPPGEDYE